ncbi:MAG: hypothetical protein M5U25_07775 [Planctomycetota bacterium]|nr:hypothetical protein [Planctomycetota bacterium]
MTFGFPAYHEELWFPRTVPTAELICAIANALGWGYAVENIGPVGWRWRLRAGLNFWSWGEVVLLEPQPDGGLRVRSSCALFTQCIDWGRNARNIRRLAELLQP